MFFGFFFIIRNVARKKTQKLLSFCSSGLIVDWNVYSQGHRRSSVVKTTVSSHDRSFILLPGITSSFNCLDLNSHSFPLCPLTDGHACSSHTSIDVKTGSGYGSHSHERSHRARLYLYLISLALIMWQSCQIDMGAWPWRPCVCISPAISPPRRLRPPVTGIDGGRRWHKHGSGRSVSVDPSPAKWLRLYWAARHCTRCPI